MDNSRHPPKGIRIVRRLYPKRVEFACTIKSKGRQGAARRQKTMTLKGGELQQQLYRWTAL